METQDYFTQLVQITALVLKQVPPAFFIIPLATYTFSFIVRMMRDGPYTNSTAEPAPRVVQVEKKVYIKMSPLVKAKQVKRERCRACGAPSKSNPCEYCGTGR